MSEANKKQVAGNHYRTNEMPQHWDVVNMMGWDYFIGNATKYIWRLGKKHPNLTGQIEDLDKAMHYLQKKRELLVAARIEAATPYNTGEAATKMGVLGMPPAKKKTLTIGELLEEIDAEQEAKFGPTAGYVDQDR